MQHRKPARLDLEHEGALFQAAHDDLLPDTKYDLNPLHHIITALAQAEPFYWMVFIVIVNKFTHVRCNYIVILSAGSTYPQLGFPGRHGAGSTSRCSRFATPRRLAVRRPPRRHLGAQVARADLHLLAPARLRERLIKSRFTYVSHG